jgi:hypothetical protein
VETETTLSPEMDARIVAIETELGAPINPLPFDSYSLVHQRWLLTDGYDRLTLEVARPAIGRWIIPLGLVLIVTMILINVLGPKENITPGWGIYYGLSNLVIIGIIMIETCVGIVLFMQHTKHRWFRFDLRDGLLTHNWPMQTEHKKVLGKEIAFDRIAAFQLCGTKMSVSQSRYLIRQHGFIPTTSVISQLNLILADPPGDRVGLSEFSMDMEALTDIVQRIAEATGKPLLVHERIDLEKDNLDKLTEEEPRLAPDGLEQTRTRISIKKVTRKTDFLSAFEDELKDDDKADR